MTSLRAAVSSSRRCQEYRHQRLAGVWSSLAQDLHRHLNKSPENQAAGSGLKQRIGGILTPHLLCLFLYRTSHYLYVCGWRSLAGLLSGLNFWIHRIQIPPDSCIGPGCFLPHPAGITFCGTAGKGLTLYSLAIVCPRQAGAGSLNGPLLGDDVTVGAQSVVLGNVQLADRTFVSFGVVVNRDIPLETLVFTNTAHVWLRGEPQFHVSEEMPAS